MGEETKTYSMEYTCSNCGNRFERKIRFGEKAYGMGGQCPYCGVYDGLDCGRFDVRRPLWLTMAEAMRNVGPLSPND